MCENVHKELYPAVRETAIETEINTTKSATD